MNRAGRLVIAKIEKSVIEKLMNQQLFNYPITNFGNYPIFYALTSAGVFFGSISPMRFIWAPTPRSFSSMRS